MFDKLMSAVTEAGGSSNPLDMASGLLGGGTDAEGGASMKNLAGAAMLVVAAKRDGKIDQGEMSQIIDSVISIFGLTAESAEALVKSAATQLNLPGAETMFVEAVKKVFAPEERQHLLEMLFKVVGSGEEADVGGETVKSLGADMGLDQDQIAVAEAKAAE